jgi:integrase/recombinase XerD
MIKSVFNQAVSVNIFISDHVQKGGNSSIYLRVIIDRKKKEFNLNEPWPRASFDMARTCALPRFKDDPDVDRVNMVISEAKGRANKIKMRYFGYDRMLSLKLFEQEFVNYMSGENFLFYWKNKAVALEADKIITPETKRHQETSYNRLMEFVGESEFLPFCDISLEYIKKFNAWLRKTKKLAFNTAATTHRDFRAYLNHALDDKYKFDYPYKKFPVTFRDGEREPLEDFELEAAKKLFLAKKLDELGQEVLAKFLFSCFTGLRIADNALVERDMITNNKLRIEPEKGFNYGKVIYIKLPDFAIKLIDGRTGVLFKKICDQTCNKYLKVIAAHINTHKKLSFRVSRDTFGTTFIDLGGDVYTLKELMGHSSIETTMIYIKLSEKRRDKQMMNFNKMDAPFEEQTIRKELSWPL